MMYRVPNREVEVSVVDVVDVDLSLSFPTRLMMGRNSETWSFPVNKPNLIPTLARSFASAHPRAAC
jgi:hypothetical protein